jgi:acyl carrier protein
MGMKHFSNTKEALAWIGELFEENPDNIKPDTPREKVAAWDSLGMLTLMSKLDEEFSIILEEDKAAELKKVGDLLDVLRVHGCLD